MRDSLALCVLLAAKWLSPRLKRRAAGHEHVRENFILIGPGAQDSMCLLGDMSSPALSFPHIGYCFRLHMQWIRMVGSLVHMVFRGDKVEASVLVWDRGLPLCSRIR